jgi:tRNA nucleotidyltransferase (CCA-adding enzyme)
MRIRELLKEDEFNTDLIEQVPGIEDVRKLAEYFLIAGFEIRLVGGVVRDLLSGKAPKDVDLCTNATPDEMVALGRANRLHVIETGLQHGTLTFVINHEPYEVTTLRIDVATDGRHAEVEWTRSFEQDAARRDLTVNAMSMDMDGVVYDYFGGAKDLKNSIVRFVGSAEQRIGEDYLRILRLFRFYGRMGRGPLDSGTVEAIRKMKVGLKQISGERIWAEMSKILVGRNAAMVVKAMETTGVLSEIGLSGAVYVQTASSNPITELAAMVLDERQAVSVSTSWKMSNEERDLLYWLVRHRDIKPTVKDAKAKLTDGVNPIHVAEWFLLWDERTGYSVITSWPVPKMPVSGNDLAAVGMKPGPEMGKMLKSMKVRWQESDYRATKEELMGG